MVLSYHHPYLFGGRVETVLQGGLCLCRERSLITNLYIDGFNLYYRALKDTPFRWLDLPKLAETLFPQDSITRVCYFTARLDTRPGNPSQRQRQQAYLRALATLPGFDALLRRLPVRRQAPSAGRAGAGLARLRPGQGF